MDQGFRHKVAFVLYAADFAGRFLIPHSISKTRQGKDEFFHQGIEEDRSDYLMGTLSNRIDGCFQRKQIIMEVLKELVDGILVINLDERTDRWGDLLNEISPYVGQDRLHRLSAVKGIDLEGFGKPPLFKGRARDKTWAGRAGCTLSHRAAITHAAAMKWRSVMILEDDIQIEDRFEQICSALEIALPNKGWDICYLGFTDPVGPFLKVAELEGEHSLYNIYGCNTTHAYIVRDSAYATLLDLMPTPESIWRWLTQHRAIDRWYRRTLSRYFNVLAVSPSIINQKQGISDITGRNQEYGHLTRVPEASRTSFSFTVSRYCRRLMLAVLNFYDVLRALFKRKRGF